MVSWEADLSIEEDNPFEIGLLFTRCFSASAIFSPPATAGGNGFSFTSTSFRGAGESMSIDISGLSNEGSGLQRALRTDLGQLCQEEALLFFH